MCVRYFRHAFTAVALLFAIGCVTYSKHASVYPPACDISVLDSRDYPADTWCVIDAAAKRYSIHSDHCLIKCEMAHGAQNVGGGCEHACFAGTANTPENVAKNGGDFYPPGAVVCANANAAKRRTEGKP